MIKMTAVILAKNEAEMISDCLKSLSFCDEILVGIDTTSQDDTGKIAKELGARVIKVDTKPGFATAKNHLIDEAKGDWILLIDADERVTPKLAAEIENLEQRVGTFGVVAFDIPFQTYILGKLMRHGGWEEEHHIRLFRRDSGRYSAKEIHEELIIKGDVGMLTGSIDHHTHRTISDIVARIERYSTLEADLILQQHPAKIGAKALLVPAVRHLFSRLIKKRAYKDGVEGIIEAVMQSVYVFLNYAKAWELQKKRSK